MDKFCVGKTYRVEVVFTVDKPGADDAVICRSISDALEGVGVGVDSVTDAEELEVDC